MNVNVSDRVFLDRPPRAGVVLKGQPPYREGTKGSAEEELQQGTKGKERAGR